jgi:hypothetical protein
MFRVGKSIEWESRLVVSSDLEGEGGCEGLLMVNASFGE